MVDEPLEYVHQQIERQDCHDISTDEDDQIRMKREDAAHKASAEVTEEQDP